MNNYVPWGIMPVLAACMLTPVCLSAGEHIHTHGHAERQGVSGRNPLVEEMVILDGVFRDVVSAVSLGDGARVHAALQRMHGTMEKTHEGVHEGSVELPRHSNRLDEFVRMDREFHEKLESLADAAHANDQKTMLSLTKQLLEGCVACHGTFR